MKKITIETPANMPNIGVELRKAIYSVARKLEADYVVVELARYNKYAEITMFEGGNCVEWSYPVSIKEN